jgi:hypothetical protein
MSGSSAHVQILPCISGIILSKGKECGLAKTILDLRAIFHKPGEKGFGRKFTMGIACQISRLQNFSTREVTLAFLGGYSRYMTHGF